MKVFDCFLFFNELELLELRLMTLNDVVDHFVIVEGNRTFTNNKKDFIFEKNSNLYKNYLDKIIYIKVEDLPALDPDNMWAIENFQRNCITRGLKDAKEEDKIIISDVDEIPNPDVLTKVKASEEPVTFRLYLFYYFVNCYSGRGWNGPIMFPFKKLSSPEKLRTLARKGQNLIRNSGWHYSYTGGLDRIKMKLKNLSDAHTRIDIVGGDYDIERKMNSQKDLWDENLSYRLINIDENGFAPKVMRDFLGTHPDFYFGRL